MENSQFMSGTETIFQRTQQTEVVRSIAIKRKDAVHHVFKNFGAGDVAVFGDVTN
ncbi:hypothetical protein D3C72_1338600 [compost metagenome]